MSERTAAAACAMAALVVLPKDAAIIATAIAGAESSWKLDAMGDRDNPRAGCASHGYWQINVCPGREAAGPPFYGNDPGILTRSPVANARAMAVRSNQGTNWGPWSVWWADPKRRTGPGAGVYKRHLGAAREAVEFVMGDAIAWQRVLDVKAGKAEDTYVDGGKVGVGEGAAAIASEVADATPLGAVADFLALLMRWDTWRRVLYVLAGGIAVVAGVLILNRDLVATVATKGMVTDV